ncbi:uncharacterized protein RCC_05781 [Ramularia collo-cygni]|uniref:GATA-type domain-containing protein n=1 Tax=Ramularia collo-cygni TaxID=112498 RepID=A0A2D3VB65_9PEZI|nr:uncharacterized protein RCC_05781 [Ramularia collo-cygni]CZT19924.1 uncharacterized protein RCC_05781 [Ramularia collo-cygni]
MLLLSHTGMLSRICSLPSSLEQTADTARLLSTRDSRLKCCTRSGTPSTHNAASMTATNPAQYAASSNQSSQNGGPPVCQNCQTSTTPLWRRDESGSVLCNACGLFLKLHGRARPISLKTDVIKSRNRVKTAQPKKRDSNGDGLMHAPNGFAAAHPDMAAHQHGLPMGMGMEHMQRVPSPSAASRSNTPQIYDNIPDTFASPGLSAYHVRQHSPPTSSLNNGTTGGQMDHRHGYDATIQTLRTRVSELEVINDLFRGRVSELEASEQDARRNELSKAEEVQRLSSALEAANAKIAELEAEGPARKKSKTESGDSTPIV